MTEESPNNPENKVAVVTGAASGIGRSLVQQLAEQGYSVAAVDISTKQLNEAVTQIKSLGNLNVTAYTVDVTNEQDVNQLSEQILNDLGRVDVVINNAGITHIAEFLRSSKESFNDVMDVNFWGVVYSCRAFLPTLIKSQGTLINISSIFGIIAQGTQTSYCASKFAVRGFTEALRQELKPKGVTVSCVHPGGIRTGFARNATVDLENLSQQDAAKIIETKVFKMSAEKAASIIIKGLHRGSDRIIVGSDAKFAELTQRLFPVAYAKILNWLAGDLESV